MNEFTTEAFSVICRNEDIFEFTQEHGLHGVAIANIDHPDENWFNPRLVHSLGYNDPRALSWKKIISPEDHKKLGELLDTANYVGDIHSGEIDFLHSKGFSIPMIYKAMHMGQNLVIALKKVSDYSHIEYNPELDFQREQLLETVLDTINVGVIACDSKGKLLLFNNAAKKWHGLPAEDIPQTQLASYYSLYEPDGKTLFRTEDIPLINMLQEGVIRKPEMILKATNGRERYVVVTGARLYDEEKNISGAVVAMHNITERKEAEENLRLSEETFRGIFEHAANGMATVDLSGKWLKVNDRLCEMLGYSREELKKLSFKDITHPQDIDNSLNLLHEMLNEIREHFQIEKRYIHKNGKIINIILSVSTIKDADSKPLQFVSQITDVTLLKEFEEKLRISEKTFRGSFKNAADGMAITDATGTCIEVNDRLCQIMGYTASELKTLNFQEVTYPDDLEEDLKHWTQLLSGERDFYRMEKRAIHKSGKIKHIIVSVAIVRDENNDPFHFITQITDISSLKEAEEKLRISEEMFRTTFKHAADGMSIADASGKFVEMNDSLCKMVGYSPDELKTMDFLEITHPDDIEDDIKGMKELLSSERDYIHKEKRYIHKNGREVPILLSVSVVKDDDSNPLYTIGQMSDITELKLAQKELDRILNVTKDQNNRLNNFAHIVSHNLRSHSGNLEMLLDIYTEEHSDAKENEIIQMALTASGKLKETIQDLNEMAFMDLAISQNVIPINLKKSVTDTLGGINALIKKANLQVYNNIPEDLEVLSLPAYMESIILNFSTNAIKYRSHERVPVLRFEAVKMDEYIKWTIEDNGIGIDLEEYGEKLFGMYKTFHHNEDAKGIGLFISKNQIEAVGGKIEVESEVNKGTVFTIFFKYEKN